MRQSSPNQLEENDENAGLHTRQLPDEEVAPFRIAQNAKPGPLSLFLSLGIVCGLVVAIVVSQSAPPPESIRAEDSVLGSHSQVQQASRTSEGISEATLRVFDQYLSKHQGPCETDPNCYGLILPALGDAYDKTSERPCPSLAVDWLRLNDDLHHFDEFRIRQRFAMAVFFCELDGGNWIDNTDWLSDAHECDWYTKLPQGGYDPCNQDEGLEVLRLHQNNLQGEMPPELALLGPHLFEVTITDNYVYGTIPSEYSQLSELDTWCVAFNLLQGPLPTDLFFGWPDMVYLDFAHNAFTGSIPNTISVTSPDLEVIYAEHNMLSGSLPTELGSLSVLERLQLQGNNGITGRIPSELGRLSNSLERIDLSLNDLTGTLPVELGSLIELELLWLKSNPRMTGSVDERICSLQSQGQLVALSVDEAVECDCCAEGDEETHA